MLKSIGRLATGVFAAVLVTSVGCPDNNYGTGGSTQVLLNANIPDTSYGVVTDMERLSDGSVVVGGSVSWQSDGVYQVPFSLTKLLPTGAIDMTFGNEGHVNTFVQTFANSSLQGIEISGGNTLIAAGKVLNDQQSRHCIAIARYNMQGQIDTGFGQLGTVVDCIDYLSASGNIAQINSQVTSFEVDQTGKLYVGGWMLSNASVPGGDNLLVVRYNADGSRDSTFGQNGVVIHDVVLPGEPQGLSNKLTAMQLQADGKILLSFLGVRNGVAAGRVARLNHSNGSLDVSFDGDGIRELNSEVLTYNAIQPNGADTLRVDSQGRILVAGYQKGSVNVTRFAVTRLLQDGSTDLSFGTSGATVVPFPIDGEEYQAYPTSLDFDQQERIVVGGYVKKVSATAPFSYSAGVRLKKNGVVDMSGSLAASEVSTTLTQAKMCRIRATGKNMYLTASTDYVYTGGTYLYKPFVSRYYASW